MGLLRGGAHRIAPCGVWWKHRLLCLRSAAAATAGCDANICSGIFLWQLSMQGFAVPVPAAPHAALCNQLVVSNHKFISRSLHEPNVSRHRWVE